MFQKQQQIIKKIRQKKERRNQPRDHLKKQQDQLRRQPKQRKRQPLHKNQTREVEKTLHPLKKLQRRSLIQTMEIAAVHRSKKVKHILCAQQASKDIHKTAICSINAHNHLRHLTTVS